MEVNEGVEQRIAGNVKSANEPGRAAKIGDVRMDEAPSGLKVVHVVTRVEKLPGGFVAVVERSREVE